MTRVLVADDQELVRDGIAGMLAASDDLDVVGQATDGIEAIELAGRTHPDLIVMDIRMPVVDGIEATRRIIERHPEFRVLVLTTFDLDEYVFSALRAGASGFLLKDASPEELVDAVRAVAEGGSLLAPSATRAVVEAFAAAVPRASRRLPDLTPRELDILHGVAQGLSNQQIADELSIGVATVKTYVSRLLMKFGGTDRVHLVIAAYEGGLV